VLTFSCFFVIIFSRTLLVYYIEDRLNFNDKDIATLFLIAGVLGIFVQGFGLKFLNECVGERNVVIIAFVFGAVNNFIYAISSNKAMLLFGVAVGSLVGMSFPTISAIKSNNVVR
jgi:MFS transporter, DHA1 family, tetracycline resistance protein